MKHTLTLALSIILCIAALTMSVYAADGTAQYANDKPVLDGEIDAVWDTTEAFASTYMGDGDGEGISGYTKILWDEDYVYFLAVVNDGTVDIKKNSSTGADSVDLWFSETNSGDPDGFNADGDWAATVAPFGTSKNLYYTGNEALYDGALEVATKLTSNGYIVEARVKYLTAGFVPSKGTVVGFNVSYNNDLDNDGARDTWNSWQSYDGRPYWGNTASLNTVEFIGEKIETTAAPEVIEEAPAVAPAAQTLDITVIASAAAVISLAGVAISKKR